MLNRASPFRLAQGQNALKVRCRSSCPFTLLTLPSNSLMPGREEDGLPLLSRALTALDLWTSLPQREWLRFIPSARPRWARRSQSRSRSPDSLANARQSATSARSRTGDIPYICTPPSMRRLVQAMISVRAGRISMADSSDMIVRFALRRPLAMVR